MQSQSASVNDSSAFINRLQHSNDPTATVSTQLSEKHSEIVKYVISASGVLFGVAFITTFALICRWRRHRRQRVLDEKIDDMIHEAAVARLISSRTSSVAKLPPTILHSNGSHIRPLSLLNRPQLLSQTVEYSVSPLATLPRATLFISPGAQLNSVDDTTAHPPSGHIGVSSRSGILESATAAPPSRLYLPAALRPRPHIDENYHRTSSTRSPSPTIANAYQQAWSMGVPEGSSSTPRVPSGVSLGIMVATTTGTLVCPSPTPNMPPLAFSTPPVGSSTAGSPALSFSDDAGATTLSPIAFPAERLGSEYINASPNANTSVELAATRGHLGQSFVRILSPITASHDFESPTSSSSTSSPEPSKSLGAVGIKNCQQSSLLIVKERASQFLEENRKKINDALAAMKQSPPEELTEPEKWFTEVDWFGADGPLALECHDQPVSTTWSGGLVVV